MRPRRAAGFVLSLGLGLGACSRTPPEPSPSPPPMPTVPEPAASVAPATVKPVVTAKPAATGAAGRCITKMADVAPPIPPPASGAACPPDPDGPGNMTTGEITFPEASPSLKVQAELAKSAHDVEKGLMYRRSMSDNQGMFFKLDSRRDHTFWMHNTCIALDMMFVEEDGLIVGIVEAAAPLTESVRSVGCESSYVLEVNAGWSRKHGVKPGQRITIPFSAR